MNYYINCIKKHDALSRDIKELIPNMNIRRRMSSLVKMGVCTALDSLEDYKSFGEVDAIITGTWLGCIADSEKFLANIVEAQESMLNPTPFIQSTFNTVGAQVALIKSLKCYNNTISHRFTSFEGALIDAMLQIEHKGAKAVLIGIFDELTPTVNSILDRLGMLTQKERGQGAIFFVLSAEQKTCSQAKITDFDFNLEVDFDSKRLDSAISAKELCSKEWCGSLAEAIYLKINASSGNAEQNLTDNQLETIKIQNDIYGKIHSQITIKCI